MPTLTAIQEFKDAKPLADVATEAGVSVDQLHDLWNAGFLRGINKSGRRHSTLAHVYEAWRLRAEAELAKKGVKARVVEAESDPVNDNDRRAQLRAKSRGWTIQGQGR